jgi:hypothetical protein
MKFRNSLWLAGTMILAIFLSSCSLGATPAPTEDPGVIQTQAVSIVLTQVGMQQTQTAMAVPPTPIPSFTPPSTSTLVTLPTIASVGTPFPFNTQLPGLTPLASPFATVGNISTVTTKNGCNDGAFMGDEGAAVVDWEVLKASKEYAHSWSILNTGTCTWDEGYSFYLLKDLSSPEIEWNKEKIVISKDGSEFTEPQHSQTFVLKFITPKLPGKYEAYWKMKDDAGSIFGPQVWIRFEVK